MRKEDQQKSLRISISLHPLPAILEIVNYLIKMSVITKKKPTTFIQTSTPAAQDKGQKALWYIPIKNLIF